LKIVWMIFGHVFLTLGVIGIFLPILPTTPFLLLTVACYSRGSQRLEAWMLNHQKFGPSLREWRSYRVIRIRAKVAATAAIFASMALTFAFADLPQVAKILMPLTLLCVLAFVWSCPSKLPELGNQGVKPTEDPK